MKLTKFTSFLGKLHPDIENWIKRDTPIDPPKPELIPTIIKYLNNGIENIQELEIIGELTYDKLNLDNNAELVEINIGNGVISIGSSAFRGCSHLMSVTIPDSVTSIGSDAFSDCSESLFDTTTVPSVKLIDGWVIGYTDSLSGSLDLTGIRGIGNGAFYGCTRLTNVTIGNSVTSIGNGTFFACHGLTSMIIPDSVTSI